MTKNSEKLKIKTLNKLRKTYFKVLKKQLKAQVFENTDFLSYLITYLRLQYDTLVLMTTHEPKKENGNVVGIISNKIEIEIAVAMLGYKEYETAFQHLTELLALAQTSAKPESYAEALKDAETDCETNWQNFWRFFVKYGKNLDSGAKWPAELLKPFKLNS